MTWKVHLGAVPEVLREIPDGSVQTCITSPPYYGLRAYTGEPGMIGLEPTLQEHLANLVAVFREVWRVLRDDGTCWINCGDAYSSGGQAKGNSDSGLAPKQRLLLPARVALALQDDGWWIRSEIIWAKGLSFCPTYSGSCMPSSVKDRPTDSHEMVYLLSKKPRYFYDADAVREADGGRGSGNVAAKSGDETGGPGCNIARSVPWKAGGGRNLRTVWTINPQGYKEAHFATFPEALVKPCILAGTSEKGACSECGAPWRRVVERDLSGCETEWSEVRDVRNAEEIARFLRASREAAGLTRKAVDDALGTKTLYSWFEGRPAGIETPTIEQWEKLKPIIGFDGRHDADVARTKLVEVTNRKPKRADLIAPSENQAQPKRTTTGWEPTCEHADAPVVPCVVLDPFSGSGTTGVVALRLGRDYAGCEISPEYLAMSERRLANALNPEARPLKVSDGQFDLFGDGAA